MRGWAIGVGALLVATCGVAVGAAGASSLHMVSSGSATGSDPLANTNGEIVNPTKIELTVSAKPALSGTVQWTVGCEKHNKVVPSKSYKKTVKYPAVIHVQFPASSTSCGVAANAQLVGEGKVTITLESAG